MSEEAELIIALWDVMKEYVNKNDEIGAAYQLLESFESHGHTHAVEEIATHRDTLDEALSQAAIEWE